MGFYMLKGIRLGFYCYKNGIRNTNFNPLLLLQWSAIVMLLLLLLKLWFSSASSSVAAASIESPSPTKPDLTSDSSSSLDSPSIFDEEDTEEKEGGRDMTEEESRRYREMIEASDGFDVEEFPGVYGSIQPYNVTDFNCCTKYVDLALAYFNHEKGTNFKCAKILKVNFEFVKGVNHYITFEVNPHGVSVPEDNDSSNQVFQAKVLEGLFGGNSVELCRPKPST